MDDGVRMGMAVAIRQWVRMATLGRSVFGVFAMASVVAALAGQGMVFAPRLLAQTSTPAAAHAAPTTTQLSVAAEEGDTRTQATFTAHVDAPGNPGTPGGSVSFRLGKNMLGSALLDTNGFATYTVDALPQGTQQVVAIYDGSANFAPSTSPVRPLDSVTSALPDYTITPSATTLTIKAGQYGTIGITLTPENGFNQIVSYSCSGLPLASTCSFTPQQVIPDGKNTPLGTTMNIQTTAITGGKAQVAPPQIAPSGNHPFYAIVLPGVLALIGLGAARKRLPGLRMLSLAVLFAVSGLGLGACSAQYSYYHHPPTVNQGTPAGLTTLIVYATSSSGNVAVVHQFNIALTVTN
jgi:hypothetical protein